MSKNVEYVNPVGAPPAQGLYSHMTRVQAGELIFVAGQLSIADFAILGWAWRHEKHQVDLSDYPNVKRWYQTLLRRPGVQRGFEAKLD